MNICVCVYEEKSKWRVYIRNDVGKAAVEEHVVASFGARLQHHR